MKPSRVFILLLSAIGVPTGASAVDVVNGDRRPHVVNVVEANRPGVSSLTIETGETFTDVCNECTIEVDNIGRIQASGADVITIRDGALRKGGN